MGIQRPYIPFTYIMVHKNSGKMYYGVKTAKGCHPSDLGKVYFSSSKKIRNIIKIEGKDSFDYIVRKEFDCPIKAVEWEHRFLTKINAKDREDFYNLHNGGKFNFSGCSHTKEVIDFLRQHSSNRRHTEESKLKMSKVRKGVKVTGQKLTELIERNKCEKRRFKIKESHKNRIYKPWNDDQRKKIISKLKGKKRPDNIISKLGCTWMVVSPDGNTIVVQNLAKFCREHGLNPGHMNSVSIGQRKHHKGFSCYKLEKDQLNNNQKEIL